MKTIYRFYFLLFMQSILLMLTSCGGGNTDLSEMIRRDTNETQDALDNYDYPNYPNTDLLKIETKADGSGVEIGTRTLTAGSTLTLYAVARNSNGDFLGPVNATWAMENTIGEFDKVIGNEIVFTATKTGAAKIIAEYSQIVYDETGIINVNPGPATHIVIENAASGQGIPVENVGLYVTTLSAGETISLYSVSRDAYENFVSNVSTTWTVPNNLGTFNPNVGSSTILTAANPGEEKVTATHASLGTDQTGLIKVTVGNPVKIVIETMPDGSGVEVGDVTLTSGETKTYYAIARDINDSFVSNSNATWTVTNESVSGVITLNNAGPYPSVTITGAKAGTVKLKATHTSVALTDDDVTGTITVVAGELDHFEVSGIPDPVGSGVAASVIVTAKDIAGNTVTNYRGTVTFSTNDTAAGVILPSNYTFTALDNGTHTFSGAVTLITPGEDIAIVWAKDTADNSKFGYQRDITVIGRPTAPNFTLYDDDTTNSTYSNSVNLRATVSSCTNIDKVWITTSSSNVSAQDIISNGVACSTTAYSMSATASGAGTQTMYLWAVNSAGLESLTPSSDTIIVDLTEPSIPGTPADEGDYSTDLSLPFTFTASTDAESNIAAYETKLYSNNLCTTLVATKSGSSPVTFNSTNGVVNGSTYYAKTRAQNGAGSWSDYSACSNGVIVMNDDVTSPAFTLFDNDTANSTYSNSVNLRATITGSCAGISKVYLTESSSGITAANIEASGVACSTVAYAITATALGSGNRTLYLWARNVAGNIDSTPTSDSIVVDLTAPTTPGIPVDDGAAVSSTDIDFSWDASSDGESGIANYSISLYTNAACTALVATHTEVAPNTLFTAADGVADGNTYYAKVKSTNGAGSDSSSYSSCSDGVLVDGTPPSGTITLGAGATYWTTNTSPTIALTQTGATHYRLCTDALCNTVVSSGWEAYTANPTAYNFNSQGLKTLYAQFRDSALNVSAIVSDSITIDTIHPSAPSSISLQDPASSPGTDATPTLRVGGLETGALVNIYTNSSCTSSVAGSGTAAGSTLDVTLSALAMGDYTFYAEQTDVAGNASTCSTVSVAYGFVVSFKQITSGARFTCGLRTDGKAFCWGKNDYYQLGLGGVDQTSQYIPTAVNTSELFSYISAGEESVCAIRVSDSRIMCWGKNVDGQLGNNSFANSSVPVLISSTDSFSVVAVSSRHACGLRTDGEVYCWGHGGQGALGTGTFDNREYPVRVLYMSNYGGAKRLFTGGNKSCAVMNDGKLYCWGRFNGSTWYSAPELRSSSEYLKLTLGDSHLCGIRVADNRLYCAGTNGYGQLGTGNTNEIAADDPASMVLITTLSTVSDISISNGLHTCVIAASNKRVYCFGYGHQGQMGNGTSGVGAASNLSPVLTSSTDEFKSIVSGAVDGYHNCGLRYSDNKAFCWGDNSTYGQTGDGSYSGYRTVPTAVDISNL